MLDADARQWNSEETGTFKAVLHTIPLGTNAGDICSKVRAALKVQKSRKSIDQVSASIALTRLKCHKNRASDGELMHAYPMVLFAGENEVL